jgi:uncharacterized damage-inducible protein DinB
MRELAKLLADDGYSAPPAHILEGLSQELAHRCPPGAPHSIYAELWHIVFWQEISLRWIAGKTVNYPEHSSQGFPTANDVASTPWSELHRQFFTGLEHAAQLAVDDAQLGRRIMCTSRPGHPVRYMSVLEQLENLAAHNAYHLGRIVLLRQLLGSWPPPSGGDRW